MSLTHSSITSAADGTAVDTGSDDVCVFSASFAQQRLWLLEQLQPGAATYNILSARRLSGSLNAAALEASLRGIVRRHEALRTTFASVEGELMQVVAPTMSITPRWIDLSAPRVADRETEARRHIDEEAQRVFDLARGPLFRATLLRLDTDEHVLILCLHHIVADGWSMGVLDREMGALYGAYVTGRGDAPLPELPIQYADFAVWQREWLQGETLESQLAYWRRQLAGAATHLDLPTDRPRPPLPSGHGSVHRLVLDASLVEALQDLSRREGVTLFMTLLAAWQTLLMRYSGQDDLVVGTPIANRNRAEIEGLIGFFVNTLPLRTDLSGDPTFRELLARVREVALGAFAHQDLPFEKLVAELQPERDTSRTPLFQVMFALQNAPRAPLTLPGLSVSVMPLTIETAKFDLTLSLADREGEIRGSLEYNTDLFDAATIERTAGHFRRLLEGIVADPDARLSRLPLLTHAERQQVLVEWNQTETEYPRDQCLHHLFAEQAAGTPDVVAVSYEGRQLTYGELSRRANRLAHALQRRGVGPEVCVGICLDPSVEFIVSLLAILKAGGAYVPLDPAHPPQRLAWMLADARVLLTLTQSHLRARVPGGDTVLCLDTEAASWEHESDAEPVSRFSATDLAYVIYTSGSTGQPKGVAVPHRAVVRLVRETDYVQLTPADRVAQASNVAFDAATFEIWGALVNGACLVGTPREILLSPARFAAALRRERISALFLTTALFNQIAREVPDAFRSVRHVLFGGEAVDPRWVREVLRHGAPERLLHVYGPTETTTFATWHHVQSVSDDATTVPIGRPIANTRTCVLDRRLQPVPIGVPGELYIGGPGVARGYLDRPELTAERFVADPFLDDDGRCSVLGARCSEDRVLGARCSVLGAHTDPTGPVLSEPSTEHRAPSTLSSEHRAPSADRRLYCTGDRVRFRADGNLEFLGRNDDQVKVRGFRVEPGEVEAVLGAHPAVRAVVVTARRDDAGEYRLVAYVVPRSEGGPTDELRRYLQQKLPDYMVPAAFVLLDVLPVTPNGKVDRGALPEAGKDQPGPSIAPLAPRDPAELRLSQLWQQVLGVSAVGVTDDFFALGGHSLMAVRLRARIEAAFGQSLPLATLFQAPTIRQQAEALRRRPAPVAIDSPLVPLQPDGSRPPFFCVYPTLGDLRGFCALARWIDPEQPFYGMPMSDANGELPGRIHIPTAAAWFIAAMRAVQPSGPYYLGGYCFGGTVAFEIAQQLHAAGERVDLLLLLDTSVTGRRPGPKSRGGLLAAVHVLRSRKRPVHLWQRIGARSSERASAARDRLSRHRRALGGVSRQERAAYLLAKLQQHLGWQAGNMAYRLYRRCRTLLPRACGTAIRDRLWRWTALDVFLDARSEYVLRRSPSRLTLFRTHEPNARHTIDELRTHWQQFSPYPVEIHVIPGDHVSMFEEPHVQVLAATLLDCLRRAQSQPGEAKNA